VKTTQGDAVRYRILNAPGFLLFRLRERVESVGQT